MDRQDPNTWTAAYASANTAECLAFLRQTNTQAAELVREKRYEAAVAGLDRILNGLIVLQNSKVGNFRPHICMFSWCEANVIFMGVDAPEDKRRQTALALYRDACDFAGSESTRQSLREIIEALESGMAADEFRRELEPTFPTETADMMEKLNEQLQGVRSGGGSTSSGSSSGGCYIATAVYGSYDCPPVWTLRRFRDDILAESRCGRAFIRCYYAISPALVRRFGNADWFKRLWRSPLDRLVQHLNRKGVEDTAYNDKK